MIETLRLGTRVVTTNPTWPHIRKIADNYRHTRYVFTRAGASVTADFTVTDDAEAPTLTVATGPARVTDDDLAALVDHVQHDLAADPDTPLHLRLLAATG